MALLPKVAAAQTLQYKGIWYRSSRASFFGELMDDVKPSGATYSPREAAILDLDQNFSALKNQLAANAVVIRLPDDDGWQAQSGGVASYDPAGRPREETGVAQEIILAVANKYGLKVIFVIEPSYYKRQVDDTFGSSSNPPGAWDFIHQFFGPALYYGTRCTTKLELVGLANSCTGDYYSDTRVAGWLLSLEWDPGNHGDVSFINKYWNYFYSLVHWNGSQTGFAGIYLLGGPDTGITEMETRISNFKNLIWPITGNTQPDVFGLEWYGNGSYSCTNISLDMSEMFNVMRDWVYSVPPNRIAWMEGGSNTSDPGRVQCYTDAINTAAGQGSKGLFVWSSDDYDNLGICYSGTGGDVLTPFASNTFTADACKNFGIPISDGWHWWNGSQWILVNETWDAQYGRYQYSATLKNIGTAIHDGFVSH